MGKKAYNSYEQFSREVLSGRVGPLASPWEEIADELYRSEATEEFDSLWDATDDLE